MHDVIAENFQLFMACQENGIHPGNCVEKSNVQFQRPAWHSWCVFSDVFIKCGLSIYNVHEPILLYIGTLSYTLDFLFYVST